jgi:GNAT superfamily N-acetyltransferase
MTERHVMGARTYLEMRDPSHLVPAPLPDAECRIECVLDCPPAFWRFLYTEVGRDHHWVDRLPWSQDEIQEYLADPNITLWLLTAWGAPAGYCELRHDGEGGVEVAYFGLLKHFHGRGLGGHFLTEVVRRAWNYNPKRVWVHTSTFDHSAALPNYLKRGFRVYKTENDRGRAGRSLTRV